MAEQLTRFVERWVDAGIVDAPTAARIRRFEAEHADSARWRWSTWVALAFGGLMLAAGVLLFVSAHWDEMSPAARLGLVLLMVTIFHAGGAMTTRTSPVTSTALHTMGTVVLGAGIYLAGQIFNLDEHWPAGLMLWALGAAIGWAVLGQWPQTVLLAILVPVWLSSEWHVLLMERAIWLPECIRASGELLLALTYFTAVRSGAPGASRRALVWLGGIALLPATAYLALSSSFLFVHGVHPEWPTDLLVIGWSVALGLPLLLAFVLRGSGAWTNLLATVWVTLATRLDAGGIAVFAWWALGATGLVAWGVSDTRRERINMGVVIFAVTVTAFYFSHVMDQLGRSASLVGLGLLSLVGGWVLERVRRQLVSQLQGGLA